MFMFSIFLYFLFRFSRCSLGCIIFNVNVNSDAVIKLLLLLLCGRCYKMHNNNNKTDDGPTTINNHQPNNETQQLGLGWSMGTKLLLILILTGMWHSLTSVPLPTLILPALIAIAIVIRMPMNRVLVLGPWPTRSCVLCPAHRSVVRLGES